MKLQIKLVNQKLLQIDIEETKSVYDLKRELSMYPDVGVAPEYQKLIYSGQVLENNNKLSTYKIDVKKFLVVTILKQPEPVLKIEEHTEEETKVKSEIVQKEGEIEDVTACGGDSVKLLKLQIKLQNQTFLEIDIEETKSVYDLKQILSLNPSVGVAPIYQKLIYIGQVLDDNEKLNTYKIDVKKFLVLMILKEEKREIDEMSGSGGDSLETTPVKVTKVAAEDENTDETDTEVASGSGLSAGLSGTTDDKNFKTPKAPKQKHNKEQLIENIVAMGYPEDDVRRALAASFNNPERAIEYLVEGIPTSPSALDESTTEYSDADMDPYDVLRNDPAFNTIRGFIQENPECMEQALEQIGEMHPMIFGLINENQEEFLNLLLEKPDSEDTSSDDDL